MAVALVPVARASASVKSDASRPPSTGAARAKPLPACLLGLRWFVRRRRRTRAARTGHRRHGRDSSGAPEPGARADAAARAAARSPRPARRGVPGRGAARPPAAAGSASKSASKAWGGTRDGITVDGRARKRRGRRFGHVPPLASRAESAGRRGGRPRARRCLLKLCAMARPPLTLAALATAAVPGLEVQAARAHTRRAMASTTPSSSQPPTAAAC